eukprot:CAMPEP_0171328442 /NCGR_PEP_ID=MMETSP0878-20121228/651_1 /TAXON_ID=67004 /ORGANISM="Thalassiosira weissflogii, Strain CCMP1336" /LENGTH=249 /DNA_ID=CAMNT_0011828295 /DNA_START=27 /DNA_END=776 /DNA_ORIENTATION=+
MKVSAIIALAAVGGASAYSVNRSTLRNLGQKSVGAAPSRRNVGKSMTMEDFGFLKGTVWSFDDTWTGAGAECISEVALEKTLNKDGLRYKMNKTSEEAAKCEPLFGLPGFTVNLPLIGETYLGPPRVDSVWEALGFTATSNNEARQNEKIKAIEKARMAKDGVRGGEGASIRSKWLEKYGYPRLVGSGGIFYADQLSSDKEPMGGFNMGKSGTIWPVPESVAKGQYGGSKGWGMKKTGPAVDGLPKVDM